MLACSHDIQAIMDDLTLTYDLKEGSMVAPTIHLVAEIKKYQVGNGKEYCIMSSKQYVKNGIKTFEQVFNDDRRKLRVTKKSGKQPLPSSYRPELEQSDELCTERMLRYLQLIGILRWEVEIRQIDIFCEVAIMLQYSESPRIGHLEGLYHILGYLKKHEMCRVLFYPKYPEVNQGSFASVDKDWTDFYGDVVEDSLPGMPEPLGKSVHTTCFVDADHAGNVVTHRSHTGVLIYVMNAPIIWFYKNHNTVERSTFGWEFVAMMIARYLIVALRYKLHMFGVPLDGHTDTMCNNQGVVKNTSLPQPTMGNNHNGVNYNVLLEAAAAGILRDGKEDTETNLVDLLTKLLGW